MIAFASLCASTALAQQDRAETLFNQGVEAMEANKLDEACPAIAESQRLDPRLGTLFTLAECEAKRGKRPQALRGYQEFLRQFEALPGEQKTRQAARKKISEEAIPKLLKEVGLLKISGVPPEATLLLDEQPVDAAAMQEVFVEPGAHRLVVRQGGQEKATPLTIQAGETQVVTPALPQVAAPAASAPAATPAPAPPSPSPIPFYAAAGVGAAGLVLGTVGGLLAVSSKSTISKECVGLVCSRRGLDAVESGRSRATLSTVGFAVGILGAGAAAGLWFSGVSSPGRSTALRVAPVFTAQQAGCLIEGGW